MSVAEVGESVIRREVFLSLSKHHLVSGANSVLGYDNEYSHAFGDADPDRMLSNASGFIVDVGKRMWQGAKEYKARLRHCQMAPVFFGNAGQVMMPSFPDPFSLRNRELGVMKRLCIARLPIDGAVFDRFVFFSDWIVRRVAEFRVEPSDEEVLAACEDAVRGKSYTESQRADFMQGVRDVLAGVS